MPTLNVFGTMFYGWKHQPGEYSSATKWLTVFYIPIFPVSRYKLIVLTDFHRESTQIRATPFGLMASQQNRFDISEKTSLSWSEVLRTYVKTFIGLPALMLGPLLLFFLLSRMQWFPHYHSAADTPTWFTAVLLAMTASTLISILYWPIWAIRKSRGMQSGQPGPRKRSATSVDRRSMEHHL
jgi:hypothetical protein